MRTPSMPLTGVRWLSLHCKHVRQMQQQVLKQTKLLKLYEERGGLYRELLKVRPPRRAAAVSGSAVSEAGRCAADGVKKARRGH